MEPARLYPSELVPMQDNKYCPLKEPGAAPVHQHTVVVVSSPEPPPKDHFFWSLCCLMYANPCCLGLMAVYFSIVARDRKMLGDMKGARKHGSTAFCLNVFALVLVIILVILFFVFIGRIRQEVTQQFKTHMRD